MVDYTTDILDLDRLEQNSLQNLMLIREKYNLELSNVMNFISHIEYEEINSSIYASRRNRIKKEAAEHELSKLKRILSYIDDIIYNKTTTGDTDIIKGETSHFYFCMKANENQKNTHYDFYTLSDFIRSKNELVDRGSILFRYDVETLEINDSVVIDSQKDELIQTNVYESLEDESPLNKSQFRVKLFYVSQRTGTYFSIFINGVDYAGLVLIEEFIKTEFLKLSDIWREFIINEKNS